MAALMAAPLAAQMRGGLPLLRPTARPAFSAHPSGFPDGHRALPSAVYLGTPLWGEWPSYSSAPSVVIIQPPATPAAKQTEDAKPITPVMIELQGDRYVRRGTDAVVKSSPPRPEIPQAKIAHGPAARTADAGLARAKAPPTVFVFRDGRRAESSDYSIISGVIYARGDYWKTGAWSENIRISDLDVSATERANQERGVPFRLPGAPNEVITRP
jgi:hypothetical protein